MTFEVGKKYKRQRSDNIYNCLFSHDVAGGNWGTFDLDNDYIPRTHQWGSDWSEYKEPRSLSNWVNIWQRPGGLTVEMGGTVYQTKADAESVAKRAGYSGWKLLDTIEVKWIEKI